MDLAKAHTTGTNSDSGLHSEELSELVIIGYSSVGAITSSFGGSAQVQAREVVMPGRQIASQSVRFELTTAGDYPQTAIATIADADVNKLLFALEKMELTNISTERFDFTEIQFELEELKITVFNNDRGHLMWALSINSSQIHFNSLIKIADFKNLVSDAKAHLDKTKI